MVGVFVVWRSIFRVCYNVGRGGECFSACYNSEQLCSYLYGVVLVICGGGGGWGNLRVAEPGRAIVLSYHSV